MEFIQLQDGGLGEAAFAQYKEGGRCSLSCKKCGEETPLEARWWIVGLSHVWDDKDAEIVKGKVEVKSLCHRVKGWAFVTFSIVHLSEDCQAVKIEDPYTIPQWLIFKGDELSEKMSKYCEHYPEFEIK